MYNVTEMNYTNQHFISKPGSPTRRNARTASRFSSPKSTPETGQPMQKRTDHSVRKKRKRRDICRHNTPNYVNARAGETPAIPKIQ